MKLATCDLAGRTGHEAGRQLLRELYRAETGENLPEISATGDLKNLSAVADQNAELLQEAQELNFKRWKILNQYVHMNFQALGSYDKEVETVKNYISGRLEKFDELARR